MHTQLDLLLCSRYPSIFSVDKDDLQMFGFECCDGWFTIIDAGCELIQHHLDVTDAEQLVATQIKEKFGGLRIYYRQGDDYCAAAVDLVESLSPHICELCGRLGNTVSVSGWMQTRCVEHQSTVMHDDLLMQTIRDHLVLAPRMGKLLQASLAHFRGDSRAAANWLTRPARELRAAVPIVVAGSVEGLNEVLMLIESLERRHS